MKCCNADVFFFSALAFAYGIVMIIAWYIECKSCLCPGNDDATEGATEGAAAVDIEHGVLIELPGGHLAAGIPTKISITASYVS